PGNGRRQPRLALEGGRGTRQGKAPQPADRVRELRPRARCRSARRSELEVALLKSPVVGKNPDAPHHLRAARPGSPSARDADRQLHPAHAGSKRSDRMSTNTPTTGAGFVPLSDEPGALDILTKSVLGLWETVNNLTRLRPTKRDRYRVTI